MSMATSLESGPLSGGLRRLVRCIATPQEEAWPVSIRDQPAKTVRREHELLGFPDPEG
jgi:hypothetical protein